MVFSCAFEICTVLENKKWVEKGVCLTARLEFIIRIILITLLFVCGVVANSLIISGFEHRRSSTVAGLGVPPSSLERVKEHATEGIFSKVLCPQISTRKNGHL